MSVPEPGHFKAVAEEEGFEDDVPVAFNRPVVPTEDDRKVKRLTAIYDKLIPSVYTVTEPSPTARAFAELAEKERP